MNPRWERTARGRGRESRTTPAGRITWEPSLRSRDASWCRRQTPAPPLLPRSPHTGSKKRAAVYSRHVSGANYHLHRAIVPWVTNILVSGASDG